MSEDGSGATVITIVVIVVVVVIAYVFYRSVHIIKERQNVVLELCGKYSGTLNAGLHFRLWPLYRPKTYTWKYFLTQGNNVVPVRKINHHIILTKSEVMDFPKQDVISRDNARVTLDAVMGYRISNPKKMIYNSQNLPYMLAKLLQAQVRNIAGTLDVDSIVDDTTALSGIQLSLNQISQRWGVTIEKVGIQGVEARQLKDVLAKRKRAELRNKEIIIQAKTTKQTTIVDSEGRRDKMITEARGTLDQKVSRARGVAAAIVNKAGAEAKSVKEIANAVVQAGENPTDYLLAVKYIDVLRDIMQMRNTRINLLPKKTAFLITSQALGMNTLMPKGGARRN